MAAERTPPQGVRENHQAAGLGHAQHFLGHQPRLADVFGHVGGEADVHGRVQERQCQTGSTHRAAHGQTRGVHLRRIGFDGNVAGTCGLKDLREIARTTADVEDSETVEDRPV